MQRSPRAAGVPSASRRQPTNMAASDVPSPVLPQRGATARCSCIYPNGGQFLVEIRELGGIMLPVIVPANSCPACQPQSDRPLRIGRQHRKLVRQPLAIADAPLKIRNRMLQRSPLI